VTGQIALAVALGAAVGAPLRYGVERLMVRVAGPALPWGTAIVNVVGSALLGLLLGRAAGGGASEWVVALVGTGFCGALTTFSGFSGQVLELTEGTPRWRGTAYAAVSVLLGLAAASAGYALGVSP